jgi:hypothetical protein
MVTAVARRKKDKRRIRSLHPRREGKEGERAELC